MGEEQELLSEHQKGVLKVYACSLPCIEGDAYLGSRRTRLENGVGGVLG